MKYNLLYFFFAIAISAHSQAPTFVYNLSTPKDEVIRNIYVKDNGNILGVGYTASPNLQNAKRDAFILEINSSGQLIDSTTIQTSYRKETLTYCIPYQQDQYLLIGHSCDTLDGFQDLELLFYVINEQLELVSTKKFPLNADAAIYNYNYTLVQDGSLFIIGFKLVIGFPWRSFIFKISPELDSIRYKEFSDFSSSWQDLRVLPDSNYWILNVLPAEGYLLDGNWEVIGIEPINIYLTDPCGLKWDSDSSFYLTGEWNGGNDRDIGFLRQYNITDTTGQLFNSWGSNDYLSLPAMYGGLDYVKQDSIFIGGTNRFSLSEFIPVPNWYFLIQTDSMLNIRWERLIGGEALYKVYKVIATSDGGCLIAGTRFDFQYTEENQRDIFIVKLNENGQFVHLPENPSIEIREAIVYPNPGTDQMNIRLAVQHNHAKFQLYDNQGRLILNKTLTKKVTKINASFLQSGTFVFRIYNEDGLFEEGKWVKIQ